MRRHAVSIIVSFVAMAIFAGFAAWAFYEAEKLSGGWESLLPIWPYVVGGALFVALLTGGLMWLAFYSANHGYDDRIEDDR